MEFKRLTDQHLHDQIIQKIYQPDPNDLGASPEDFLACLRKASAVFINGKSAEKTRAVCTLLHGNEPSGVRAIYDYLKSNAVFIIASVEAASCEPVFSNRMLPGKRDLNRCFNGPFDDEQGLLARAILELVHEIKPECLVDLHNTSGSGPAFGVAITEDQDHLALTSLFTNDLIVTDLRLGALMELSEQDVKTVTIECGGANDPSSQIIATEGLHRFLSSKRVLADAAEGYPVNVYHNPVRLETKNAFEVAYEDNPNPKAVLTLPSQAEKFNYGTLTKDESIGILGNEGFSALTAKDQRGREHIDAFFEARDGGLYPRHPIKVFMVTKNPLIAKTDCLFYFISVS